MCVNDDQREKEIEKIKTNETEEKATTIMLTYEKKNEINEQQTTSISSRLK